MPGEVRIQVDVDAAGHYRFRVRTGAREITTDVDADLATSFYEDLRLLRWKSVGVRDPRDVLLNHVGDRLADLLASPERWNELGLLNEVRQVRVQFSQAAHRLMPFPWELLRVNNEFLIGARGSHLVREAPAPAGRNRKRNPLINIVHISLGTDSALRFDEERCTLLETVPASIPIEFLIDPSAGHVEAVMDGFRPHIVIVSGHGHYDDLRGEHYLSAGRDQLVPTARLVAGIVRPVRESTRNQEIEIACHFAANFGARAAHNQSVPVFRSSHGPDNKIFASAPRVFLNIHGTFFSLRLARTRANIRCSSLVASSVDLVHPSRTPKTARDRSVANYQNG